MSLCFTDFFFFFFNDTATTEIYTLSLHDALPISVAGAVEEILDGAERQARKCVRSWTDGVYHGETILDDDGHGTTDIWICADRKSTRLNSSHGYISYAVFCLKKKKQNNHTETSQD